MSRALLCLGCCLALSGGAIAQTANDANHGFRFSKDGPNANTYTCSWWGLLGEYYFLQHSEDLIT